MAKKEFSNPEPNNGLNYLNTLELDGEAPERRINDVVQAQSIFQTMCQADIYRSQKRATLKGLVDGNPPYSQADLNANGRAYQCNVNWRVGDYYFNKGVGAFYDLTTESKMVAEVCTNFGTPEQKVRWSECISANFDWMVRSSFWDYNTQISQNEMVLYGVGPMIFEDNLDWRPVSCLAGSLKVPERAKSDTGVLGTMHD